MALEVCIDMQCNREYLLYLPNMFSRNIGIIDIYICYSIVTCK